MRAIASRLESRCRRAEQHQVLAAGEPLVERGLLAGQRDLLADGAGVGDDVMAGDERAALGRGEEGGEDADGGGLAGAVVAEQTEHRAGLDREVEAG